MTIFGVEIWPIIISVLSFSFLVFIHELGHFLAAKRAKVKVLEFGIGFPPRVLHKKVGETRYSLNLIPFGGFVKLYGEDAWNPKMRRDPKSFASKTKWQRFQIITAGVIMNFLFAIIALTIGFSLGIDPLLSSYDEVIRNIEQNRIEVTEGFVVKSVIPDGLAAQNNIKAGDKVIEIDGQPVDQVYGEIFGKKGFENYEVTRSFIVERPGSSKGRESITVSEPKLLGLKLYEVLPLKEMSVVKDHESGLMAGDIITQINGQNVRTMEEVKKADKISVSDEIMLERNDVSETVITTLGFASNSEQVAYEIEEFLEGDVLGKRAGLEVGDVVLGAQGKYFSGDYTLQSVGKDESQIVVSYQIDRAGEKEEIVVDFSKEPQRFLGVFLKPIYTSPRGISLAAGQSIVSLTNIQKVKLPVHEALVESTYEVGRLSLMTMKMFGSVLGQMVTSLSIPDGVAGPVGVAKMTVGFAKQGWLDLLRFIAFISLSLAAINILPLPALDGGRLLFLIIEGILGKPLNAKAEAVVHTAGFFLFLMLIVLVTINDVSIFF